MTVCVAAITENGSIIGASDRMLTAGDVQFEPQQSKIVAITRSIFAMIAGDAQIQSEVLQRINTEVSARLGSHPTRWLTVAEIAYAYSDAAGSIRNDRAERSVLRPLGLTYSSYISQQLQLSQPLAKQIASELINFQAAEISAIITGVDESGPHLFIVDYSDVKCLDRVGFAAIGAGNWHAQSQFMFEGHTPQTPFPRALLLTYSAKKRAEVAPGVGRDTDMFCVWALGQSSDIGSHVIDRLEQIYQEMRVSEKEASRHANGRASQFVEEIAAATGDQEQTSPAIEAPDRALPANAPELDTAIENGIEQPRT